MKPQLKNLLGGLAVLLACHATTSFALTTNFFANFQTANGTSNATTTVLNSGTVVGTWSHLNLASGATGVGAISSNAANRAYVVAHDSDTVLPGIQYQPLTNFFVDGGTYPGTYYYDASGTKAVAEFASAGSFTGSAQTLVSFKWGAWGTANAAQAKGQFVRGLDASNNEVFKLLFISGSATGTRIFYARGANDTNIVLTTVSAATPNGAAINSGSSGTAYSSTAVGTDPAEYLQVSVLLTNGQVYYTLAHSQLTGTLTANLPVNSGATTIAKLEFSMMWNNSVATQNKGFWVDDVIVTDGPLPNAKSYVWKGNLSSDWNIATTSNWVDTATSLASTYTEGGSGGTTTIFDDTATTASVNLPVTVSPNVIQFSNSSASYTLSGPGKISGSGTVVGFTSAGTVTMSNTNDFAGTSTLTAGRVRLGTDTGLGAGIIVLNNGALSSVGSAARSINNAITLSGNPTLGDTTDNGPLTFNAQIATGGSARSVTNNSDVRFAGGVQGSGASGAITKKYGPGKLTLNGSVNMSGVFDVFQGTVVLDGASYTNIERLRPDAANATDLARVVITNGSSVLLNATGVNLVLGSSGAGTNIIDLAGLLTIPSPTGINGSILFNNGASAYGEVNFLPGGDFTAYAVRTSGGANPTRFNFNGGILRARVDNATFFEGLTETFIRSGGAVIDSGVYAITVNQDLLDGSGGGGLVKIGSGTLTLGSSNNTYTGSTVISNGTLNLRVPFTSSSVVPSTGTTVGFVVGKDAAATKTLSSLTLPGTNGLLFTFASDSVAPAGAVVTVPTVTASGDVNVAVAGAWPVGTYTLLDYTTLSGSPNFVFGSMPIGVVGYLTNDTSVTALKLVVTFAAGSKVWYGNTASGVNGGLWDITTTANWDAGASQYNDNGTYGDFVTFDSSVSPNLSVELSTTVHPVGVMVTNASASDFVFFGPGKISGTASLTKWLGGDLKLNTANDYKGGTFLRQGSITLGVADALPTAGILTFGSPSNTVSLVLNGFDQTIAGLIAGGGVTPSNKRIYNGSATPATLTFNSPAGTNTDFTHTLGNVSVTDGDNFGIVKNGLGEQRIGTSTYSGTTVANAGRLVFTGNALAVTNTVTVNSGATLAGAGSIGGSVILNAGSTLSPANNVNGINVLTLTNNLTMTGAVTNWFDLNKDTLASDRVTNVVDITYSGSLIVTNLGTNALAGGETFQLFSATGTKTGNFASVTVLPATGATGTFDPATGVLTINVPPSIPTTPTNLTFSVSGGSVNLSWPSNYLGWSLQVQTNTLGVGIGTNWFTVPGTELVTSTNFPVVPTNPAVFYRMFYLVP